MKMLYFYCGYFLSFLAIIYAGGHEKSSCFEREKALALLETAENLLSKAGDAFPSCKEDLNSTNSTECEGEKPLAYLEISRSLISDVRENFPTCPEPIQKDDKTTPSPIDDEDQTTPKPKDDKIVQYSKPTDCSEVLANGRNESGVYVIWPSEQANMTGNALAVYCDMNTDGGGWTVIQRRGEFPVQQDFFLDWESYKNGFGNLTEEFWLGNENIRVLCHKGCKIRFDLEDASREKGFALYQNFRLLGSNYTLEISNYTGNVGDSMKLHNAYTFSTKDHGRTQIATEFHSGWWHRDYDYYSNLNGIYRNKNDDLKGVFWFTWRDRLALSNVEIKIIPKKS